MDIPVVKNALGSLDELLGKVRDALWDIERERSLAFRPMWVSQRDTKILAGL
jgi:hypothetical protein